jgi:hypothetical protein
MVGSDRPLDLSLKRMRERRTSPRLARDLAELDLARAESLLGTFLMGRENMARFAGDAPLVTDDRPLVEFTGPRSALAGRATVAWNVRALAPHAEPPSRYLRAEGLEDEALLRQALDARFDAARKEWAQAANR